MIKIEHAETYGWEAAMRGMRNPLNSWKKADSTFNDGNITLGENDIALAKSLAAAGNDHGKFLRMIGVSVDITAPLYWWKEFDTYKVGTVANSCSTMHKIQAKKFTLDDFSCDHLDKEEIDIMESVILGLNWNRTKFKETSDKTYWWHMIQLLPSSYNQKRTVTLNYAVLKNQYHARKNHKLDEWRTFCEWVETLPYFKEICIDVMEKN